jgi:hypothetical protein
MLKKHKLQQCGISIVQNLIRHGSEISKRVKLRNEQRRQRGAELKGIIGSGLKQATASSRRKSVEAEVARVIAKV